MYAHRGSSASYPELTRSAFVEALAEGADGVECDVHLSRDGHLVLHHDAHLGRTSNGSGALAEHTLDQLRGLDHSSWKGVEIPESHGGAGEQFMTLDELLDLLLAAGRPVGLAVETKHPSPQGQGLEDALLALLARRGWDPATGALGQVRISVMSFDPDAVRHLLGRVAPRVVCQLVDEDSGAQARENLRAVDPGRASATGRGRGPAGSAGEADNAGLPGEAGLARRAAGSRPLAGPGVAFVREHTEEVAQWLRDGSVLRVWTVDTREETLACLALGVQQLTTNVPRLVRQWCAEAQSA